MTTKTKPLSAALSECARPIGLRESIPILSCAKVSAANGVLKITTSNLDMWVTRRVPCDGDVPECCVHFNRFKGVVSQLAGDSVSITVAGNKMSITSGKCRLVLPLEISGEFLEPDISDAKPIAVVPEELADGLDCTSPACHTESVAYPILTNVLVSLEPKALKCFANDGRRGNYYHGLVLCETRQFMVPAQVCAAVSLVLREDESELLLSERFIVARSKHGVIVAKRPEGQYSDSWQQNADMSGGEQVTLAKSLLQAVAGYCATLSRGSDVEWLDIALTGTELEFSTELPGGIYNESFPLESQPSIARINPTYLKALLPPLGDLVKYSVGRDAVFFESGNLKVILGQLRRPVAVNAEPETATA